MYTQVEAILYITGLVIVVLYIAIGIDDFIWDAVSVFRRINSPGKKIKFHQLESEPPKLLAMAIAAWREDNVIGDVIDNIIDSTMYPKSMYYIFLGIYPNDEPTLAVAKALEEKHSNVHVVVNCKPGPTSKAQNINYVISYIKEFEQQRGWQFASLTIHDSEDVVHPYELKLTDYLINTRDALQFPVIPLIPIPKLKNFFTHITTSTYADEFAENHFATLANRNATGAFVPSAGTGFALSRAVLDSFGDEDILPANSLTEDYRLSLTLYEKEIPMYYVLESIQRINYSGKMVWDYVATRSMFPNTFKTAVKQKTRWILGITMQSFKFKDIFAMKGLRFVGRYSMYKDFKAKVSNLLVFLGYPVLLYVIISFFIDLPAIFPMFSLSWWLSLFITVLMVERQAMRIISVYHIYGKRSAFFSCLFPPLVPIRLVWGNVINFVSTIKAYRQSIFGNQAKAPPKAEARQIKKQKEQKQKKQLAWAKTDHTFLEKEILKRYHRRFGDILLEHGYIYYTQLQEAVMNAGKITIGQYCLNKGWITDEHILEVLSHIKQTELCDMVNIDDFRLHRFAELFDKDLLKELLAVPILHKDYNYVFAFCEASPVDAQLVLIQRYNITIQSVLASKEGIENALESMFDRSEWAKTSIPLFLAMYQEGYITYEQAVIAHNYKNILCANDTDVLSRMGLLSA